MKPTAFNNKTLTNGKKNRFNDTITTVLNLSGSENPTNALG
jgi:hypothetical protein